MLLDCAVGVWLHLSLDATPHCYAVLLRSYGGGYYQGCWYIVGRRGNLDASVTRGPVTILYAGLSESDGKCFFGGKGKGRKGGCF